MLLIIVLPRVSRSPLAPEPELVGFLRAQHGYAIANGRANTVVLHEDRLEAQPSGATFGYPPDTAIDLEPPARDAYMGHRLLTTFYPDGTLTAASLTVAAAGVRYQVRLSPFSGVSYRPSSGTE